jgi:hypothetical protein
VTKNIAVLAAALTLIACGGSSSSDSSSNSALTCGLGTGSLTGTWRTHYTQTDGNCGAIPDETNMMGSSSMPPGCTLAARNVSADNCHLSIDFTCPTSDNLGTQHWVVAYSQVSATEILATGTVQVSHATLGTCRSTYNVDITKL